ncbi:alpha/beta hydrolase-fold protein [Sorangium sp. So ce375]|uniref:alpha/beta hydrolase n=1 Tax=Sorangium sp. So ce375 TaxID=3133306 RepID=UPI003F5B44B7
MLALLLSTGWLAGSSAACDTPSRPPSASNLPQQASAVAPAAPPAKAADTAIIIGERQIVQSTILGEERPLLVHTPESYKEGKSVYPVLYLLDGEEQFHHTTGITTFLSAAGRAPEMIVVGVVNTGDSRERDLTPTPLKDKPGTGGAGKFLSFLKDELRPRIEGAYRTAPYRILVGHSFGGLFGLHTLTSAPDTFNAYVAMSPSLWWDDKVVLRAAEKSFASHESLQAFLYMTMGNESGSMLGDVTAFAAVLKANAPKGLEWEFKHLDRETHGSITHRSTYDALEKLFTGWEAPPEVATVKALQAHYEALSKKFHFEVKLTEALLNGFAFNRYEKHRDEAMAAFKLSVELHPNSPGAHNTLGQAYEDGGQLDLAKANFEIAVQKATAASDPALPEMKANLERVSKLMAK